MQRVRFIVAGMQRSGTTVTHVGLKDHPNVSMTTDEVTISPFFTKGLSTFTGGKESYRQRRAGYVGLFDLLTSHKLSDKTLALGLKTAIGNHQEAIEFCNCLREYLPDVRLVLVTREDLVAQHGSLLRAERSGEWHAWEGQKTAHRGTFAIDPEQFAAYAADCRRTLGQLRTLHRTHQVMELVYENDIADGVRYDRLFQFLEVPVVPVTWQKMSKVAPPADSFIENYRQLQAMLPSIPASTEQEEIAAATRCHRERARTETPNFLLHRACDLLERGEFDEACADIDTALDIAAGKPLDASLRARVYGLVERAAAKAGVAARQDLLAALAQGCAENPYFLAARADVRLGSGAASLARDDVIGVLTSQPGLDPRTLRWSFQLLEQALEKLNDAAAAQHAIEALRAAHGDSEHYLVLSGVVAHKLGRNEEAVALLRSALAKSPGHPRARDLLARLQGG